MARSIFRHWVLWIVWLGVPAYAAADVVVLANRTSRPIGVTLHRANQKTALLRIASGAVASVPTDGRMEVEFDTNGGRRRYLLDANAAYFFGSVADRGVDMQKIGLGGTAATSRGRSLSGDLFAPGLISVKVLVDEEERANRRTWERRLRKRIARASDILEQHCHLRLEVVAVGIWNSDNNTNDFIQSLIEFEQEVQARPAQLAIGFTSQYQVPKGKTHLGGTRGPLKSHILLREWSQHIGESERLEILVHELGHHLGAAHSREKDSVMRPVLGDRQAIRAGFPIKFDPVNALIMSLVAEEVRRQNVRELSKLTGGTKRRLRQIYTGLDKAYPADTSARRFLRLMDAATVTPLVAGTQKVLQAIVRTAHENSRLPETALPETAVEGQLVRVAGDELTELYVRGAARAATTVRRDIAGKTFLFALGIGLDESTVLTSNLKTKSFVRTVESSGRRVVRLGVLGKPTLNQRRDLAQHFVVSAYLAAAVGAENAEKIGIAKELLDAVGGTGFSFADLAANKAGIALASGILKGRVSLDDLAESFTVAAYMPATDELPEGLKRAEFVAAYGHLGDERFEQMRQEIDRRILALPGYSAGLARRAETGP